MYCSQCGYDLGPFDTTCPRCQGKGSVPTASPPLMPPLMPPQPQPTTPTIVTRPVAQVIDEQPDKPGLFSLASHHRPLIYGLIVGLVLGAGVARLYYKAKIHQLYVQGAFSQPRIASSSATTATSSSTATGSKTEGQKLLSNTETNSLPVSESVTAPSKSPPVSPDSPQTLRPSQPKGDVSLTYRVTGVNTIENVDIRYRDSNYKMVSVFDDRIQTHMTNIALPWSKTITVPAEFLARLEVTNRDSDGQMIMPESNSRVRAQIIVGGKVIEEDSNTSMVHLEASLRGL